MVRLNPWIFGVVVSITVVITYALCTLFWFAFTEPSINFLNTLFHGMDFRKIYGSTAFSMGNFLYVFVVFAVWSYLVGVIYATVRNLVLVRGGV